MRTTLLLALAFGPTLAAPRLKDPPPDPLLGRWAAERVVCDGVDRTETHRELWYTFTPDGLWAVAGEADPTRRYFLRPAGDGTIDLTFEKKVFRGRYRVTGDTLYLSYAPANHDRPDALEARENGHYQVMKRVKKP